MEHRIGTPARDGQDDAPPACSVCGSAETFTEGRTVTRSRLVRVPDAHGVNLHRYVCPACLERALKSLGAGTSDLHVRTCTGRHRGDDDSRYGVVAVWPPHSHARPPYWLACARHLTAALDEMAIGRTTS
jgi:hypothetical protein